MNETRPPQVIRLAIVDDHTMMREGLSLFIESTGDMHCVWTAQNAAEAVSNVERDTPDVLIVDISLPDRSGLELIKDLHLLRPAMPVLAVSMHDEKLYAQRALKSGAKGYVMKNAPQKHLAQAIRRVAGGGIALSEEMSEEVLKAFSSGGAASSKGVVADLTDREFEVFQMIGNGQSTNQIAEAMKLSTKTVDVHKMNIRNKLNLKDGSELTFFAFRWMQDKQS
jgi:DNA-binding NarL/FixJ family response regulator